MMKVTLAQYNRLTPEQRRLVTEIDARVADEYDEQNAKVQAALDAQWDYDNEEQGR